MTLIDQSSALKLDKALSKVGERREIAGGSAANTIVGIAELGVRAAYMAKIGSDATGKRFVKGLDAAGVQFATKPSDKGATSRCLIAVTPDGERSMSTFLGASTGFAKGDVVTDLIRRSKVLYLEGYLFDKDKGKTAFMEAARQCRNRRPGQRERNYQDIDQDKCANCQQIVIVPICEQCHPVIAQGVKGQEVSQKERTKPRNDENQNQR